MVYPLNLNREMPSENGRQDRQNRRYYTPLKMTLQGTDISGLLVAWSRGDKAALDNLMPLVYGDLREIARRQVRRCRSRKHILQSGSLAHEAYLRLVQARGIHCKNRAHFFALCSQMIRRILVDYKRKQHYGKRGGEQVEVHLDEALLGTRARGVEVEALDEALTSLARLDARKARVVELRFFGGLNIQEIAEVLELSEETITRDWRVAKALLFRELAHTKTTLQA
jgi:RNA polymerase sigma factor (TIGR02999 family)